MKVNRVRFYCLLILHSQEYKKKNEYTNKVKQY